MNTAHSILSAWCRYRGLAPPFVPVFYYHTKSKDTLRRRKREKLAKASRRTNRRQR